MFVPTLTAPAQHIHYEGQCSWKLLVSLGYKSAITTPLLAAIEQGGSSLFHLAVRNIGHFRP
jgi:hypothetical protein